ASPVTAPMSDCFEPWLRSSPQAYAGHAAAAPASATPSTPARIVDANVVMLPPVPRVRNALVPVRSTVHRTHASLPCCKKDIAGMLCGETWRARRSHILPILLTPGPPMPHRVYPRPRTPLAVMMFLCCA